MKFTPEYIELQRQMHQRPGGYGGKGGRHAQAIKNFIGEFPPHSIETVLDYGAGQRQLHQALVLDGMGRGYEIFDYDPAVEAIQNKQIEKADIVVCTDVLEHIEPDCLTDVLDDIFSTARKAVFLCIACGPAGKDLPDGRNAHLIQAEPHWWIEKLSWYPFKIMDVVMTYASNAPAGFTTPKHITVRMKAP